MANTYSLLASTVLTGSQATVTFSGIPQNYTDLVLKISARGLDSAIVPEALWLQLNSDTGTNYSSTILYAEGTTASSTRGTNATKIVSYDSVSGSSATSNTFGNLEIYIPSYTAAQNKPIKAFGVAENNSATSNGIGDIAGLWRSTNSITTITVTPGTSTNFVSGSSFYLYGISKS